MADTTVNQTVNTVESGGAVVGAINQPQGPVHVGGQQYYAPVTIQQGATADEVVAALRTAGMLDRLTARVPEAPFRHLLDIVGRAPQTEAEGLVRIYHATLPPTAHVRNNPIPSLLLADLCDQPILKAWPPLFEFVERMRLAQGIALAMSDELRLWVDANAGQVTPPVPAYEIERLRKQLQAEQKPPGAEAPSWLQVYLEPDWLNRTQERKQPLFRVELVLSSPRTNGPLVLEAGQLSGETKQLWMLDELPSLLDRAFANPGNVAKIPDLSQLVIEVVAPSDVLLFGFERWKRNNTPNTYAMFHPLVVRLRDRLTIPNPADQRLAEEYWRQKWNTFHQVLCLHGCEALEWRDQDDLDVFELQDDADLACLGLASPLLPDKREVFDVLRDAGIPIAIWLRGPDLAPMEQANLPERISTLIQGKPLSGLFKAVQELRRSREVRTDAQHIGNALTLLWDDPDRPPLKYEEQGVFV